MCEDEKRKFSSRGKSEHTVIAILLLHLELPLSIYLKKIFTLIYFYMYSKPNVKVWFNDFLICRWQEPCTHQRTVFKNIFHTGVFNAKRYNMLSFFFSYNCEIFSDVQQKPIKAILKFCCIVEPSLKLSAFRDIVQ
jgi:hypothetical protein